MRVPEGFVPKIPKSGYTNSRLPMIVLIAPYLKLKQIADSLVDRYPIPIKTVVGDLSEGLALAREAVSEDAILVSRGGTAKLIREVLGIDVIEIGVSYLDLVSTLKPYMGGRKRIAVAGFRALIDYAESVCKVLDIQAEYLPVDDEVEMPDRIRQVRCMDVACLVGDMVAVRSAKDLGLPLALIESGSEAVAEALDKAALVARSLSFRWASDLRLGAVLNTVKEGIIAVDQTGQITHINRTAKELLGKSASVGLLAETILPGKYISQAMTERREISGRLWELEQHRAVLNITPILSRDSVEGAVIVLQEVAKIQDIEKKVRRQLSAGKLVAKYRFEDMASQSPAMCACLSIAKQYAHSTSVILIYGETGTGKERLAQSIHNESPVRDGPFVAINCGALPPTLLESELFGYEEGAFTGAGRGGKMGLFELSHGGTIFLDEINQLDVQLQGKLLRVIQEREVMRVGGLKVIPVNFRLIAASNVPLQEEMERGKIRRDLFYRLNVLDIRLPPLRERLEDIEQLFLSFVKQCALRDSHDEPPCPPEYFIKALKEYDWPGNVRELENIAEKWTVLCRLLDADTASDKVLSSIPIANKKKFCDTVSGYSDLLSSVQYSGTLDEIIYHILKTVLVEEGGNISRTAKRLGINRQTVKNRLGL